MTGEPIARVKAVSHRYGATVALDDVSIDIPSRIMVCVIGPDGVGKSTLLGLIAGVRKIQTGEVVVFHDPDLKRMSGETDHRRINEVSYVELATRWNVPVGENVAVEFDRAAGDRPLVTLRLVETPTRDVTRRTEVSAAIGGDVR